MSILRDGRLLVFRVLVEGRPPVAVEDKKSVRLAVGRAKEHQRERPSWKPAPDYPWRQRCALVLSASENPEASAWEETQKGASLLWLLIAHYLSALVAHKLSTFGRPRRVCEEGGLATGDEGDEV